MSSTNSREETLAGLLSHATGTVPFYHCYQQALLRASAETATEQLQCFPLMDRSTLRTARTGMISSQRTGAELVMTSGTTGPPIWQIRDLTACQARNAALEHVHQLVAPHTTWNKSAFLVPFLPDPLIRTSIRRPRHGRKRKQRIFQQEKVFSTAQPDLSTALSHWNPDILIGAPRSLLATAYTLTQNAGVSPKLASCALLSIDEPLLPPVKDALTDLMEGPILDLYAMRETAPIAGFRLPDCSGFHTNDKHFYIEILNEQQKKCLPGERGEIVITDLTNFTAPLIRYRTGDSILVRDPRCSCNLATAAPIQRIEGRISNTIHLPDGTILSVAPLVWSLAETTSCVSSFHQAGPHELSITLYPLTSQNPHLLNTEAQEVLHQHLGPDSKFQINIASLNNYLSQTNGKFKFVTNK